MRTSPLRPAVLLATLAASLTVVTTAPPAAAAETVEMIVTNQYGGGTCAYNQDLVVINGTTGAFIKTLGSPDATWGVFNEAKPFDLNRKIVALWAGSVDHNQKAGIGVYDRTVNDWVMEKVLPTSIETGAESPHSIAVLPGGYFAVAHAGSIAGAPAPNNGFLMLFDPQGNPVGDITQSVQLTTAHGVEWDGVRQHVFAVGGTHVKKYSFGLVNGQYKLTEVPGSAHALPTSGGHDLRRRRVDNNYFLTTNTQNYIYRPDDSTNRFSILTKSSGAELDDWVKAIDQRFDGFTAYSQMGNRLQYLTQSDKYANFCANWYKGGRWLWAPGEKVYPEDTTGTPPPTGYDPNITVGANSSSTWIEIYAGSDVTSIDAIGNNGAFYINLPKTSWGSYAASPPGGLQSGQTLQLIVRRSSDGASAATEFPWLQDSSPDVHPGWNASIARGANCSTTWVEMVVTTGATAVSVRAGTGAWTALTYNASWGKWVKAMNIASGTKVVAKATRADGATAYSPIFTWMQ